MSYDLLNTLYVVTPGAKVGIDGGAVTVKSPDATIVRFPLVNIRAIYVFGAVTVSPNVIDVCTRDGRSIAWFSRFGRFRGRLEGRVNGNVLLRRMQHLIFQDESRSADIARTFVAGKIQNSRRLLQRGARDAEARAARPLRAAVEALAHSLALLTATSDLDYVRGVEGEAARTYFGVFPWLIKEDPDAFIPAGRSRRPPLDRTNALLSFLYGLLRADAESALSAVGFDPQVGFLHRLRPGRPSLALDLMEELRPVADRFALRLINKGQIRREHFDESPSGAMSLTDAGRRKLLSDWQEHRASGIAHPILRVDVPIGMLPNVQSKLLARWVRGDIEFYPPFIRR